MVAQNFGGESLLKNAVAEKTLAASHNKSAKIKNFDR